MFALSSAYILLLPLVSLHISVELIFYLPFFDSVRTWTITCILYLYLSPAVAVAVSVPIGVGFVACLHIVRILLVVGLSACWHI